MVWAIAAGEIKFAFLLFLAAGLSDLVDGYLAGRAPEGGLVERLSAREREILVLLADGLSNGDIAARLYLGVGTVKDHVSAILTKLEVSGRVQAALAAERAGLLREHR